MPIFHCIFGIGEYSVPTVYGAPWLSRIPAAWKVWCVVLCENMDKKRSLKQLEFTDCCTLECPLARDAVVYSSAVAFRCDGHKSSGVISQLSSGADTMGCCVRRRSRWSDPEWSGCWHWVTLVWRHRAPRASASVCSWVVSWGSELSHRHQPLTYCHQVCA